MEVHLKNHTESMTRLRIYDLGGEGGDALFSRLIRAVNDANAYAKGKGKDEEAIKAVSPGGQITKRQVRSRPVSQGLWESELPTFAIAVSGENP